MANVRIQAPPDRLRYLLELQRRAAQRRYDSPLDLACAIDPAIRISPALKLINGALVGLMAEDSPHNALAVFIAAQEGKSSICSRRLPEWVLSRESAAQVAIVSYQADIAVRWGREIKRDVQLAQGKLPIIIREDSSAAGRWDTPEGGGVYCTGVGGPLTGRSVGRLLIIDDPVKDRAAAESATIRESTWDWYESVALTRLGPRSRVVLIQTRFHEDDLAGRILSRPGPLNWKVIKIPAIAQADDPLGRQPGEELESVRGREPGYFHHLRATMSPYVFSGMYQQSPTAPEGNFFRRPTFRYWRHTSPWNDGRARIDREGTLTTLADCWMFGTVDVAASTKTSADFTVVSIWCVTPEGDLVLLDRRRQQVAEHDHFTMARKLFAIWGRCQLFVERHFFATTLIKDALADNIPVVELEADTDKVTRAIPAAGRIHAGRVWFPAETSGCECGNCEGAWLDEWCDELASFPSGEHDDQADTLSYAARVITMQWSPAKIPARPGLHPHERTVQEAARSSTGYSDGIDLMNTQW